MGSEQNCDIADLVLIGFLDQANANRGNLIAAIARKRRNARLAVIGVIAAVASAVCALIALFR